jgi:TorA maturation chaperone TorD
MDPADHLRRAGAAGREVNAAGAPPRADEAAADSAPHTDEAAVGWALARAAVYRLLGTAFAPPSPSTLAEVAEAAGRAVPAAGAGVAAALRALAAAARASAADEVAGAYVTALERPAGPAPYEGSYGAAPLLAGKGTVLADVAGFYAAFGLMPAVAEVEDHIAAELEFMSVLALKEAAARAEGLDEGLEVVRAAQIAFLRDHLGRWGPSFAADLGLLSDVPYYASAAGLLGAWLAADMGDLGVDVERLEGRGTVPAEDQGPFACPMVGPADAGL